MGKVAIKNTDKSVMVYTEEQLTNLVTEIQNAEMVNSSTASAFDKPEKYFIAIKDATARYPTMKPEEFTDILVRGRRCEIEYGDKLIMVNTRVILTWIDNVKMEYLFGWREKFGDKIIDKAIEMYGEEMVLQRARFLNKNRADEFQWEKEKLFDVEYHSEEWGMVQDLLAESAREVRERGMVKAEDLWENN